MKRSRGTYARLICLRCRSRKVKCILPDDDSLQPSPQPQPAENACQRCRQNGFECIVDHTTLGRPSQKRQRSDLSHVIHSHSAEPGHGLQEAARPPSPRADTFLLMQPEQNDENAAAVIHQHDKPTNDELCEALMSPVRLLTSLLVQDLNFASSVTGSRTADGGDVLALVDHDLASLIDEWRVPLLRTFYNPYLPSLVNLRAELRTSRPGAPSTSATTLLFAVLCLAALDVPTERLVAHQHLQPILRGIVFEHGQETLFAAPPHMHTVLALTFIAVHEPLALIATRRTAPGAIIGKAHITCAKKTALLLGLDAAHAEIPALIVADDDARLEARLLDCLLWCRLSIMEANVYRDAKHPLRSLPHIEPALKDILAAARLAVDARRMPVGIIYAYFNMQVTFDEWVSCSEIARTEGRLDSIADIILKHEAASESLQQATGTWSGNVHASGQLEQAFALLQISEMETHARRANVVGFALFFAVIAGANPSNKEDFGPDEAVRISEHLIRQLKAHGADDPNRPPLRIFLETFGESRMDIQQRNLTNFIGTADLTIDGIAHTAPTRRVASEVLFFCKDIVEGNAARYTGWGGMHDNTDTLLILFQSCAQKMEGMSRGAGSRNAAAEGNLLAASAKLIRNLHRIMTGWKRSLAEAQQLRMMGVGGGRSGNGPVAVDAVGPDTDATMPAVDDAEWPSDDFFLEWSSWPHFDALDLSGLFGTDFNEP